MQYLSKRGLGPLIKRLWLRKRFMGLTEEEQDQQIEDYLKNYKKENHIEEKDESLEGYYDGSA